MGSSAETRHKVARLLAQYQQVSHTAAHELLEREARNLDTFYVGADDAPPLIVMSADSGAAGDQRGPGGQQHARQLVIAHGDAVEMTGTCAFFVHGAEGAADVGLMSGAFAGSPLEVLSALLREVYAPILSSALPRDSPTESAREDGVGEAGEHAAQRRSGRAAGWAGQLSAEAVVEFVGGVSQFADSLSDAVRAQAAGLYLRRPDKDFEVESKAPAFQRAAADPRIVVHYDALVEEWSDAVEELLQREIGEEQHATATAGKTAAGAGAGAAAAVAAALAAKSADDNSGPLAELDQWKHRINTLASVLEQSHTRECKAVVSVLTVAKSKALRRWKPLDTAMADSLEEARENVKFLAVMEKQAAPLYAGTPTEIKEALPGLLASIRTLHASTRYYASPERVTGLLAKCTNQMIARCRAYVEDGDGVWVQPVARVQSRLRECFELYAAHQLAYKSRDKSSAATTAPGGQKSKLLELNTQTIFAKHEQFARRLEKLIELFATIEQFRELQAQQVDGIDKVFQHFTALVDGLKRAQYRVLDYRHSGFDRDYVEFSAAISETEALLLQFVNSAFEKAASTPSALKLLRQLKAIMKRASLRDDLEGKFLLIFHKYETDLEAVQAEYEAGRTAPPIGRNMTPVSGAIAWSRHLLGRIEGPMSEFNQNSQLMGTREAKKIVKMYNRVARTLIEFEYLWTEAWTKSVEAQRAGLSATLLVRHAETGKYHVNLDPQVLHLCAETRWLMRLGAVAVPERATLALYQQPRLKAYLAQLEFLLQQYEAVGKRVPPRLRALLQPHLDELERRLQPGLSTLMWTSMNIEGFLHSCATSVARVAELVGRVAEFSASRLERNLLAVATMRLLALEGCGHAVSLDQFVATQEAHIGKVGRALVARAGEVERDVVDLIDLVQAFSPSTLSLTSNEPRAPTKLASNVVRDLRLHYSRMLYRAVLIAVRSTLRLLRRRLCGESDEVLLGPSADASQLGHEDDGFDEATPFFELAVTLAIPDVSVAPSLDEAQAAINSVCRKMLSTTKPLRLVVEKHARKTIFDELTCDKDVVLSLLLLTGAIERERGRVRDFLSDFRHFGWLWEQDKRAAYEAFAATEPSIEAYDAQLASFAQAEQGVASLPASAKVGSLHLHTAPLRSSLKAEIAAWRTLYTRALHERARAELVALTRLVSGRELSLRTEVSELDALRARMDELGEVERIDGWIESRLAPVEDMYAVLGAHAVRVPQAELRAAATLRGEWRSIARLAADVRAALRAQQATFQKGLLASVRVLQQETAALRADFDQHGPAIPGLDAPDALVRLRQFEALSRAKGHQVSRLARGEQLFGLAPSEYPDLDQISAEMRMFATVYDLYDEATAAEQEWLATPWHALASAAAAAQRADEPAGGHTGEVARIAARLDRFDARARAVERALRELPGHLALVAIVARWRKLCAPLQLLSLPAMRSRHWSVLMAAMGARFALGSTELTVRHLVDARLLDFADVVADVAEDARREHAVERALHALASEWDDAVLPLGSYRERGALLLRAEEAAALVDALDEAAAALAATVAQTARAGPFREPLAMWTDKLAAVHDALEQWLGVQGVWLRLEPLFGAGEVARQLPHDAARFRAVDGAWVELMAAAAEARNVVAFCVGHEGLRALLAHLHAELHLCVRALAGYLERKRLAFPRFYFVADAELLDLLARGSEPAAVQPQLCRLFDSIGSLAFGRVAAPPAEPRSRPAGRPVGSRPSSGSNAPPPPPRPGRGAVVVGSRPQSGARTAVVGSALITHIVGIDGQWLRLDEPLVVAPDEHADQWLRRLLDASQLAVHSAVQGGASDLDAMALGRFAHSHVSQVAQVCVRLVWAFECDDALRRAAAGERSALGGALKRNKARLGELAALVAVHDTELLALAAQHDLEHDRAPTDASGGPGSERAAPREPKPGGAPPLPPSGTIRLKLEALVVLAIYQHDAFELAAREARAASRGGWEFAWARVLRTEWLAESAELRVTALNASLPYGHEFAAAKEPLVVTPLTERCFVTFTQALHLCLGGAAVGPAGTGKTETIKALGAAAGRWVLVSNCSEGVHARALGAQLKGLAQSGCWACFDEIDRMSAAQLALVGDQLASIVHALARLRTRAGGGAQPAADGPDAGASERFTYADGEQLRLDTGVGVFVTLNAGARGAARELPECVRAHLRVAALVVPERCEIVRVKLLAAGYADALALARKVDTLFRLCAQQLCAQPHYDWGLRALMAVVRTAARWKRVADDDALPSDAELVARAAREQTLPRLEPDDDAVFLALLEDVFGAATASAAAAALRAAGGASGAPPGGMYVAGPYHADAGQHGLTDASHELGTQGGGEGADSTAQLQLAFVRATDALGLVPTAGLLSKAHQLADCAAARHAVCVLGPAGSGKSALLALYMRAVQDMGVVAGGKQPRRRMGHAARRVLIIDQSAAAAKPPPLLEVKPPSSAAPTPRAGTRRRSVTAAQAQSSPTSDSPLPLAAGQLAPQPPSPHTPQPAPSWQAPLPAGWGLPHRALRLFPRAQTRAELFGAVDPRTGAWTDGAFCAQWRRANADGAQHTWLVLDGPIEPSWVEDLNSAMDDSQLLTLPNGERLPMRRPNVTLCFESADLAQASPATVSRVAVVALSGAEFAPMDAFEAALARLVDSEAAVAQSVALVGGVFDKVLEFVHAECAPMVSLSAHAAAQTVALMVGAQLRRLDSAADAEPLTLDRYAVHALVCVLGGALDAYDRAKFDGFLRSQLREKLLPPRAAPDGRTGAEQLLVFDHALSVTGEWSSWESRTHGWLPADGLSPHELADEFPTLRIPTAEGERADALLQLCAEAGRAPLLVGGAGCGKSFLALAHARSLDEADAQWHVSSLCGASTPRALQAALERRLERRQGRSWGVPGNRARLLLVVDDLAAAPADQHGTRPCLELVRQLVDAHALASAERPGETCAIRGLTLLGVMRTRLGGRSSGSAEPVKEERHPQHSARPVSKKDGADALAAVKAETARAELSPALPEARIDARTLRHFLPIAVLPPSPEALGSALAPVFELFLDGANASVQVIEEEVEGLAATLVELTLDAFARVAERLRPTALGPHAAYSLRDLFRVLHALLCARVEGVLLNETAVVALWAHEATGVLAARLVDEAERQAVAADVKAAVASVLSLGAAEQALGQEPWLFSHFGSNEARKTVGDALTPRAENAERAPGGTGGEGAAERGGSERNGPSARRHRAAYEPLRAADELAEAAQACEARFNASIGARRDVATELNLVFFDEALAKLTRLVRVLRTPRAHALLVGAGGSGKRSLARLGLYLAECQPLRLPIPAAARARAEGAEGFEAGGGGADAALGPFFDAMRSAIRAAGLDGRRCALQLGDAELADDGLLEQVHHFVQTGELVPDAVRPSTQRRGDEGGDEAARAAVAARPAPVSLGGGLFGADEVEAILEHAKALHAAERTLRLKHFNDFGAWQRPGEGEGGAGRGGGGGYNAGALPLGGAGGQGLGRQLATGAAGAAGATAAAKAAAAAARVELLAEQEAAKAIQSAAQPTREQLWRFFVDRARLHVHVLVVATPGREHGQRLLARAAAFPALFAEVHVDWFAPWPKAALLGVAERSLAAFPLSGASAAIIAQAQASEMVADTRGGAAAQLSTPAKGISPLVGLTPGLTPSLGGSRRGGFGGADLARGARDQPDEVLEAVDEVEELARANLATHMVGAHALVCALAAEPAAGRRRVAPAAKTFFAYVDLFKTIYAAHAARLLDAQATLADALARLQGAADDADVIQLELDEKEKTLALADDKATAMLQDIVLSTTLAERKRRDVATELASCLAEKGAAEAHRRQIDAELALTAPVLREAELALAQLSPKDISMLKTIRAPPELIKRVFDCVLLIRREPLEPFELYAPRADCLVPRDSWRHALQMLAEPARFLDELARFNKHAITEETLELLYPYLAASDFNVQAATRASADAGGMCVWVRAMAAYAEAQRQVQPRLALLARAEDVLASAKARLARAEAALADSQADVDRHQSDFERAVQQRQVLDDEVASTRRRLRLAARLLQQLDVERERWAADAERVADALVELTAHAALAAALVAYLGPYADAQLRADVLTARLGAHAAGTASLAVSRRLDVQMLVDLLADEPTRAGWGAPATYADALAVQNCAIVASTKRWPFAIDPQGQARAWIVRHEAHRAHVLRAHEPGAPGAAAARHALVRALERCLARGGALVLDGAAERLEPCLDALLRQEVQLRGPAGQLRAVLVGDDELAWSAGFRLYVICAHAAPELSAELCAEVCVVDFTATAAALAEQLLAIAVRVEQPELEDAHEAAAARAQQLGGALARDEARLLALLAELGTSLLADEAVLDALDGAHEAALRTREQLRQAADAAALLHRARAEYAPLAQRGANLCLAAAELARASPAYVSDFAAFMAIYTQALEHAERAGIRARRVANVVETLTAAVSALECRSVFERDARLWPLLLALHVALGSGEVSRAGVRALLLGADASPVAALARVAPIGGSKAKKLKKGGADDAAAAGGAPTGGGGGGGAGGGGGGGAGSKAARAAAEAEAAQRSPFGWLSEPAWQCVMSAAAAEPLLSDLPALIPRRELEWRAWSELAAPEAAPPPELGERASPFARLLLVRAFRPDRLAASASAFVTATLGRRHAEPPRAGASAFGSASAAGATTRAEDWAAVEAEAPRHAPILLLTAPGGEAARTVGEAAKAARVTLVTITLGPGQRAAASRALNECRERGDWLLVQSAHLRPDWLHELEGELARFATEGEDADAADAAAAADGDDGGAKAARPAAAASTQRAASPTQPSTPLPASRPPSALQPAWPKTAVRTKYQVLAAEGEPAPPRPTGARGLALLDDELVFLTDGAALDAAAARAAARRRFRLWLCAEPVGALPRGLVRACVRLVAEPPAGLRAQLQATLASVVSEDTLDEVSHPHWRAVVLALCYTHAALRERRGYGALGFAAPYDWAHADLAAALRFAQASLRASASKAAAVGGGAAVDWQALRAVALDVHHGGRVTDAHDARVLAEYGTLWLAPPLCQPGFAFSNGYPLPPGRDLATARAGFASYPHLDEPSALLLHANAELAARALAATSTLETLASVHLGVGKPGAGPSASADAAGAFAADEASALATISELLSRQPPTLFAPAERQNTLRVLGGSKPVNLALVAEIEALDKLLTLMKASTRTASLVLDGGLDSTAAIREMLSALALARVPADWAAAGRHVGGASLGPWLATVQQRSETLAAIAKGHRPSSYSLATLSNPQGFLAANVQEAARKRAKEGWTLDAVGIATKVLTFDREDAQARKGLDEGVYIHGLHLDGCRWDRQHGRLIEPLPRVLTSALPVVHVTAVLDDHWRQERPDTARVLESPHPTSRPSAHDLSAELSAPPGASSYACPCYKHPRRGAANFVFDIDLRTDEPVSKWVLRSVCVLTQLIP